MELSEKASIGGTLLWYYSICPREVWLMSRKIIPEQKDENVAIGRLIDKNSYVRDKHQISFGDNKFDFIQNKDGSIIVSEIKKSSRTEKASMLQLAHYLYELEKEGYTAKGVLVYPKEKKRTEVILTDELRGNLDRAYTEIERISVMEQAPPLAKCRYCAKCAYRDYCWS